MALAYTAWTNLVLVSMQTRENFATRLRPVPLQALQHALPAAANVAASGATRNTHWTRLDKCQGPPGSRGSQA